MGFFNIAFCNPSSFFNYVTTNVHVRNCLEELMYHCSTSSSMSVRLGPGLPGLVSYVSTVQKLHFALRLYMLSQEDPTE